MIVSHQTIQGLDQDLMRLLLELSMELQRQKSINGNAQVRQDLYRGSGQELVVWLPPVSTYSRLQY